jgi:integrase
VSARDYHGCGFIVSSPSDSLRNFPQRAPIERKRDRALLLIGFAGALRHSELVALDVSDVDRVEGGIIITLRRSKGDQESGGQSIAIPARPQAQAGGGARRLAVRRRCMPSVCQV